MLTNIAKQYTVDYVPLEDYGIDSVAFTLEDAIRILDVMEKELVPILGGDVYMLDGAELRPTYQNWSCERLDGQDMASFVHDRLCPCPKISEGYGKAIYGSPFKTAICRIGSIYMKIHILLIDVHSVW